MPVLLEAEAGVEPPAERQGLGGPGDAGGGQAPVESGRRGDREVGHPARAVHTLGERRVPLLVEVRDGDPLRADEREHGGLRVVRVHGGVPRGLEPRRDREERAVDRALALPALRGEDPRVGDPEPGHVRAHQRERQAHGGRPAPPGERRQEHPQRHRQHRDDGDQVERLGETEVPAMLGEHDHRRAETDDAGDEPPAGAPPPETGADGGGQDDQREAREPAAPGAVEGLLRKADQHRQRVAEQEAGVLEDRRGMGQRRAERPEMAVHGPEHPDRRAAEGECQREGERLAAEPGPREENPAGGHRDRDRVNEVRPPGEPGDQAGHEQRAGAIRARGARVRDAQAQEEDEEREDRHEVVVETRIVGPLQKDRRRDQREEGRPAAGAGNAPGQEGAEPHVKGRQGQRQQAERLDRRAEQREREGVEVAVDRAHVRLPVEVHEKLAGEGAAAHQPGRPLVEPDDGRGGGRQAHDDARDHHDEEAQGRGPPRPPRSLLRRAPFRHACARPESVAALARPAGLSRVATPETLTPSGWTG